MILELPLGFIIDLSFWADFLYWSVAQQAQVIFAIIGWPFLVYYFFKAGADLWVKYRQSTRGTKNWQWVILAVDIPPLFIQTPKAVEQIFAHLSGAQAHINVADKFWHGKKQKWFSFEIISIEGYIQFLVRTEVEYRDLVEASVYAQYPEAEITEVEDYVDNIPNVFSHHSEYDMLGVEFKLTQPESYPIRTYPSFEYTLSKDAVFSDPMAAILENFTRIGHGENLWMHIIIEPTDGGWKEAGIELVKELMGEEPAHHGGGLFSDLLSGLVSIPGAVIKEFIANIGVGGGEGHEEGHEERPKKKELSPGGKKTVEAVEDKIAKIGFKSKLRVLYAARREVFNPARCIEGFVGAINQFHELNRNALSPALATHAHYDRRHKKSNKLKNGFIKAFRKRDLKWGKIGGYILNIEELATVWHFPLPFVKTPLLQRAGPKRAEPPAGLPTETMEGPLKRKPVLPPTPQLPQLPHSEPPAELPYG